jgi:secondary thiamine-phosphate synthase enzyme
MQWLKAEIHTTAPKQGLHDITGLIEDAVAKLGAQEGMLFLNLQHTSAALAVSENYDPTAKTDLETFLARLAPEGQPWYDHTLEGPDDSPSHMRSIVTGSSLTLPIDGGRLTLGTWQGIFLCEHRRQPQRRTVLLRVLKMG